MPLTAYVLQIVAWALVAAIVLGDTGDLDGMRALHPFWPFFLGTVLVCTVWALTVGRGPLESLSRSSADVCSAADRTVGSVGWRRD
jgi:uncharacterized membrane protein YeiB